MNSRDVGGSGEFGPRFVTPALPAGLDTPMVVLDLKVMEANIGGMAQAMAARGVTLRPHFKTPKMVEVARRQLAAGSPGLTCATVGEAEVLADAGIRDVFIAYPVWPSAAKALRLRALCDRIDMKVGIDDAAAARTLAKAVSRPVRVLVEVDCGDRRTGAPPEQAGAIAAAAADAGLVVDGVFTHGGQGYTPGERAKAAEAEVAALQRAAAALRAQGLTAPTVSAGSTPTAVLSARGVVTEERPGTYVFGDRQQVVIGSCQPKDVAVVVASTVVSTAVPGQFVIDAGAKTIGKDRPEWLSGHGLIPAAPQATITRLSDHHAVCEVPEGAGRPQVGEVVAVVPNHICPVINLAPEVVVVRNGRQVARWTVDARARNT
jgi:D-serine deaminase-like pyridoxal phosphate-dependent protein